MTNDPQRTSAGRLPLSEVKNLRGDWTLRSPTAGWRPLWIMAAAKLFLLSCLVAVVGYLTYKELQVSTLGLAKEIHIPAKRSDVFQKLFDDPEFYLKIHPLWYVFLSTLFHNREVSFDIFRLLVPSGFQKPRCRCEFDRRTKFQ